MRSTIKYIRLSPIVLLLTFFLLSCNSELHHTKQDQVEQNSYLVINAIVNKENKAELTEYLTKVLKVFKANGGKPIGKYKAVESLGEDDSPEMIAIIAFPDDQKIKEMINSKDFKNLGELRARVFDKLNLVLCTEL